MSRPHVRQTGACGSDDFDGTQRKHRSGSLYARIVSGMKRIGLTKALGFAVRPSGRSKKWAGGLAGNIGDRLRWGRRVCGSHQVRSLAVFGREAFPSSVSLCKKPSSSPSPSQSRSDTLASPLRKSPPYSSFVRLEQTNPLNDPNHVRFLTQPSPS